MSSEARTYLAQLRTLQDLERQRDLEGYMEAWGWWVNVCPGGVLTLRDATAADVARCSLREGSSEDPADWLCELGERGSLVSRKAVAMLTPQ